MSAGMLDERADIGSAPDESGRELFRISEVEMEASEASAEMAGGSALAGAGEGEGIDFARLERGLRLRAVRVAEGRYHVTGGSQEHWVDLYTEKFPRCDCGDHIWRDSVCKHMLAALVREGDERVVRAIGELVETLRAA